MLKKDLTNEPTFDETRATMETFRSRCLTDKEIEKRKAEAVRGPCTRGRRRRCRSSLFRETKSRRRPSNSTPCPRSAPFATETM